MFNFGILKALIFSIILSVLSALLAFAGWPDNNAYLLLFIGLVPLFYAIDILGKLETRWKSVFLVMIVFIWHMIWMGLCLRWLNNTSPKSYQIAVFLESLTLALSVFPLFYVAKRLGNMMKWLFFIVAWLTIEYCNQNWMIGTPYFIFGGGFGKAPQLIQCYEYIGIEGGSLLLLTANLGFYFLLKGLLKKQPIKKSVILLCFSLLPFCLSLFMNSEETEVSKKDKIKVLVVHSYLETYQDDSHKHPERTVERLWEISSKSELDDIELVLWPETIISNLGWLADISNEKAYISLSEKLKAYPNLSVCFGGYGFSLSPNGANDPYSAFDEKRNFYYQAHNVAVTMDNSGRWPIRSKQIFIPFQERIPLLETFPFLKNFADIVGSNTMISYYEHGDNIHKTRRGNKYVPILCFESTYPLRMAENARDVDFIAILANENWNKDLSGSEQYLYSSVAMAIQSRTSIVRSSNSGISTIINSRGKIVGRRKGKETGTLVAEINRKEGETFYEMIAGLIYGLAVLIFFSLIIVSFIKGFLKPKSSV